MTTRNKIVAILVAWIQLFFEFIKFDSFWYVILHDIVNIFQAIMTVPLATKKSNPTGTFFWAEICSFVITWIHFNKKFKYLHTKNSGCALKTKKSYPSGTTFLHKFVRFSDAPFIIILKQNRIFSFETLKSVLLMSAYWRTWIPVPHQRTSSRL